MLHDASVSRTPFQRQLNLCHPTCIRVWNDASGLPSGLEGSRHPVYSIRLLSATIVDGPALLLISDRKFLLTKKYTRGRLFWSISPPIHSVRSRVP